jgi:hypothetical protein
MTANTPLSGLLNIAKIFEQPIDKLMFLTYYLLLGEEKETHNRKLAT